MKRVFSSVLFGVLLMSMQWVQAESVETLENDLMEKGWSVHQSPDGAKLLLPPGMAPADMSEVSVPVDAAPAKPATENTVAEKASPGEPATETVERTAAAKTAASTPVETAPVEKVVEPATVPEAIPSAAPPKTGADAPAGYPHGYRYGARYRPPYYGYPSAGYPARQAYPAQRNYPARQAYPTRPAYRPYPLPYYRSVPREYPRAPALK